MMDECVGFEAQFTSVMQNVLRTTVGEATKLFEQTLQRLKAELLHLRQENVDLKSGIFPPHSKPKEGGDGCPRAHHAKRDVGVQCGEFYSYKRAYEIQHASNTSCNSIK